MSDRDSVVTVDELRDDIDDPVNEEQGNWKRRDNGGGSYSAGGGVGELASKVMLIESKKYYIDVKESRRGRFVKISEVSVNGAKNRMTMEMKSAIELHDKLTEFIDHIATLGPKPRTPVLQKIMSETIYAAERRYYLDLKENSRGRFLKIAMTMPPPSFDRSEVVIPSSGMVDFRDALTDLLNEFGKMPVSSSSTTRSAESASAAAPAPAPVREEAGLALKCPDKTFYFTVDTKHGVQLKISEVRPNFRTAVSVPQPVWNKFTDLLRSVTGLAQLNNPDGAELDELGEEPVGVDVMKTDENDDDVIWTEGPIE